MDALSELLRVIRLSGTAFIDADLYAPWAVETPPPSAIAARLAPGTGRIIPYHLVTEGACHVRLKAHKPVAFVVPRAGVRVSENEIRQFALARAPAYQHPRRVWFVDELPVASTHKIDRRRLIQQAMSEAG